MGTWGAGNFDSDTAADHLSILTERLVSEVEEAMSGDPVELEPDEYWGVAVPCNLEILHVLASRRWVGVVLPEAATVEAWKATYLAVWDATIDGLEPAPEHRTQRRAALERTFDQLVEAIRIS
ncbi:hypothetical protein GCM10010112_79830 [Actinoplanes lobatus]|uniref:DUF4259 domain-containing protein n=1 Tax=Actinoplanes lobatus TaxID=113568 RepID=A0A7W7MIL0_9ACTN|nr:DUF4259 domain-containing protein [Actinoplanes lobatus]MBB4751095.1 hypothetical protein [Actinoplanes lobatus]GGN92537.1 hypothetical protein GCM10010112_79830 [Actinoplanes lobatus]GIE44973.1 hypothetical protein Alo02nite_78710 [Actinoplanes lobatus]